MADLRPQIAIKITDPTNNAQSAGVDAGGNLQVILASNTGVDVGDVDVTSVIPGVAATNLGKAVDDPVGATDTGVAILVERIDTPAAITPPEADYTNLFANDNGMLWTRDEVLDLVEAGGQLQVDIVAALPIGTNEIGDIRSITTNVVPGGAAADLGKAEDAAHTQRWSPEIGQAAKVAPDFRDGGTEQCEIDGGFRLSSRRGWRWKLWLGTRRWPSWQPSTMSIRT